MARLVTMVFTDLVNSTAIKSHLPGEDISARNRAYVDTVLRPHRQRVEADLATFGGRVVKTEGDAYFLVFDVTAQAAHWAAALQQSHRNDPIPTPLGPLEVKVGIHTGAPLTDPNDPDDYIGREVDYAARIAALANGGQITLSEAAAALIRAALPGDSASYPHGERVLKGIGRVPIFELLYGDKRPQPLKEAALAPSNLPVPPVGFLGRADLLAELRHRLHAGGVTILKGEGGNGKTALALVAAHQAHAAGELPGGVAWVNCELGPGREECLRQMAHVFFGDRMEKEHVDHCHGRVRDHLRKCGALVVLDNFETVVRDAGLLRWLADIRAPACVLVTTRELPAGQLGQVIPVRELPREEAIALFRDRAAAGGLALAAPEKLVNDLCAAVGDQPLAIELLATRAARLPLTRLLDRFRRDSGILDARADPTRPGRHQSIRACFALSHEHLSPPARDLLARLSAFPDGAGEEVITAVAETQDWDEAAEELVAASLWRLGEGRYTAHPLVRQCALENLGGRRAEVERQAIRAFTQLALDRGKQTTPGSAPSGVIAQALDWFAAEWRNLLACADLATTARDWDTVCRLGHAASDFWNVRGYVMDAERLYGQSLAAARQAHDRLAEGRSLNFLGMVYRHQGRLREAEAVFRECLALRRAAGDDCGEGYTWSHLSRVYMLQERYPEAEAAAQQGLGLLDRVGDAVGKVMVLAYLGAIASNQGRYSEAEAAFRQSLDLARESGNRHGEGTTLNYLGDVYRYQDRWDEAEAAYLQSRAIAREFLNPVAEAAITTNLGVIYQNQGRWAEAEMAFQSSLMVFRDRGERSREGGTLRNFARLKAARGDLASALDLCRQAVTVLDKTQDSWLLADTRALLADLSRQAPSQSPP